MIQRALSPDRDSHRVAKQPMRLRKSSLTLVRAALSAAVRGSRKTGRRQLPGSGGISREWMAAHAQLTIVEAVERAATGPVQAVLPNRRYCCDGYDSPG